MDLVVSALAFAAEAHKHQRRKDKEATPYINHPISLLHILAVEAGVEDEEVLAAALLHDYLEDCCGEAQTGLAEGRQQIRSRFGAVVLAYVEQVTDDKSLPKEERKTLQISKAAGASHGAKLVKLADKVANLRDLAAAPPYGWSESRIAEYYDWAGKVVAELRGTHTRLEELFDEAYIKRPLPLGGRQGG